jgi:hypothetical protein
MQYVFYDLEKAVFQLYKKRTPDENRGALIKNH